MLKIILIFIIFFDSLNIWCSVLGLVHTLSQIQQFCSVMSQLRFTMVEWFTKGHTGGIKFEPYFFMGSKPYSFSFSPHCNTRFLLPSQADEIWSLWKIIRMITTNCIPSSFPTSGRRKYDKQVRKIWGYIFSIKPWRYSDTSVELCFLPQSVVSFCYKICL